MPIEETHSSEEVETAESTETPTETAEEAAETPDDGSEGEVEDGAVAETETDEDADYLPDEQSKEFPVEVLSKYAKRYGYTQEEVQNDPRVQTILKDKINSDILIAKSKEAEPTPEEEESVEDVKPVETERKPFTPEQLTEHYSNLSKYANSIGRPEAFEYSADRFLKAFGHDPKTVKPEQKRAIGSELFTLMVDGINTYFSDQRNLEQILGTQPEVGEFIGERRYSKSWGEVAKSDNFKDVELPAYGSKEFQDAVAKLKQEHPWVADVEFKSTKAQAQMLAKFIRDGKVTPEGAKKFIEKGKEFQKKAQRNAEAGKVLGAGKSASQGMTPKDAGKDDFRSAIERYNASQRSTGK